MEILSTGEKIKRARIYKGITLKELCDNEISISKMSCIENGKVKADEEILRYIAKKIDLDYDYLAKDIWDQIIENLKAFNDLNKEDKILEQSIKLNLEYAMDYEYYSLAFELMNRLFNYYLNNFILDEVLEIVPKYYDLYTKCNTLTNTIVYFKDMGNYLFKTKEYKEAKTYYSRVNDILIKNNMESDELFAYVNYKKGMCFFKTFEYLESEKLFNIAKNNIENVKDNELKGKIYHGSGMVSIFTKGMCNKEDIEKAFHYFNDDPIKIGKIKIYCGEAYFSIGEKGLALNEIKEAITLIEKSGANKGVNLFIKGANILSENDEIDLAEELSDKALNIAIEEGKIDIVEKAYYLKGMLLQKQSRFREAELYMNLSLDSLVKFGTRKDLYGRYIDMANMYHKTNSIQDSIKYFTLAMKMKKNI